MVLTNKYRQEENYTNILELDNFHESIDYSEESGYNIRSASSEYRFDYYGTTMELQANTTLYATFPEFSQIIILVNDELYRILNISDTSRYSLQFPTGYKRIRIIESLTSKPSTTILGTFITGIFAYYSQIRKIPIVPVDERIVFLGDSITVGGNADAPSWHGYAALFKKIDSKNVSILGYGYGKLKDFAETTPKINEVISQLNILFANVTTKKLLIALGTNDFAIDSTPALTFEGWYEDLLDAIILDDNTIDIYCLSPIIRSSDGALLDSYRSSISTLCAAKSECTHIEGKTILTTDDLDDGVHPHTQGHLKLHDEVDNYLI